MTVPARAAVCGVPWTAASSVTPCREPARVVLADQQGAEVEACAWHWLDALERSQGLIRAVRLIGQRPTRVERFLVPSSVALACTATRGWYAEPVALPAWWMDELVDLADGGEAFSA